MSTIARISLEEYERMAEAGVFHHHGPRHLELIYGQLREFGEPAKLTLDEYERMVAAGVFEEPVRRRLEFIRGEIREMSPINPLHADLVVRLTDWSYAVVPRGMVRIRVQAPIRLPGAESAPEPDLVWAVHRDYSQRHPSAEDILLIVEVAESSLAGDLGEKAVIYASAGIREYWVIDVAGRRLIVHRDPVEGAFREVHPLAGDWEASPLAVPDAVLRPATLWE